MQFIVFSEKAIFADKHIDQNFAIPTVFFAMPTSLNSTFIIKGSNSNFCGVLCVPLFVLTRLSMTTLIVI